MSRKSEIVTAVSALGCAAGIGFFMQSGEVAELRYGTSTLKSASSAQVVGETVDLPVAPNAVQAVELKPLQMKSVALTSARIKRPPPPAYVPLNTGTPAAVDAGDAAAQDASARAAGPEESTRCTIEAAAEPQAAAMVEFTLNAPCAAGQEVLIRHEELIFSAMLSGEGSLTAEVPALSKLVVINAFLESGETVAAEAAVDSLALYDRVVVQWRGTTGVQIHAREFGAGYGEEGHVWSGASRDLSAIAAGNGGYMTKLGDVSIERARIAEVYTFPAAHSKTAGAVDLTVETEVTAENCGRDIEAHAMQFSAGKEVSSQVMTLAVPGCDAVGSFLVLNNLLQDLTVASK